MVHSFFWHQVSHWLWPRWQFDFNFQSTNSEKFLHFINNPGRCLDIHKISMIARSDPADHLFPRHKGYFPSPPSLHYWGVTRNPLVHLLFWCKNHLLPHTAHCTHSGYDSSIPQHNIHHRMRGEERRGRTTNLIFYSQSRKLW